MKIALIDVDGHNFPNLALMKLSAYHKRMGDSVEWYSPLFSVDIDTVYISKVFSFSDDCTDIITADKIVKGGTGYNSIVLDPEIEDQCPDYSLYALQSAAYGFLSRGCPRNCPFCIVSHKEGFDSHKVSDLSQFWHGEKNIFILDPNLLACPGHVSLLTQLAHSGAFVTFSQGLDIRLISPAIVELLKNIRVSLVHFSWDNFADKNIVLPLLKLFASESGFSKRKMCVYVLTNFNSTFDEDMKRIVILRDLGYNPFVMIFEREKLPKHHRLLQLQRWVNNRRIFNTVSNFDDYNAG